MSAALKCGVSILLSGTDKRFRFSGAALKKHEDFADNDVWVEIPCELQHGHEGKHRCTLFENATVEWDTPGGVWLAK